MELKTNYPSDDVERFKETLHANPEMVHNPTLLAEMAAQHNIGQEQCRKIVDEIFSSGSQPVVNIRTHPIAHDQFEHKPINRGQIIFMSVAGILIVIACVVISSRYLKKPAIETDVESVEKEIVEDVSEEDESPDIAADEMTEIDLDDTVEQENSLPPEENVETDIAPVKLKKVTYDELKTWVNDQWPMAETDISGLMNACLVHQVICSRMISLYVKKYEDAQLWADFFKSSGEFPIQFGKIVEDPPDTTENIQWANLSPEEIYKRLSSAENGMVDVYIDEIVVSRPNDSISILVKYMSKDSISKELQTTVNRQLCKHTGVKLAMKNRMSAGQRIMVARRWTSLLNAKKLILKSPEKEAVDQSRTAEEEQLLINQSNNLIQNQWGLDALQFGAAIVAQKQYLESYDPYIDDIGINEGGSLLSTMKLNDEGDSLEILHENLLDMIASQVIFGRQMSNNGGRKFKSEIARKRYEIRKIFTENIWQNIANAIYYEVSVLGEICNHNKMDSEEIITEFWEKDKNAGSVFEQILNGIETKTKLWLSLMMTKKSSQGVL